jgi:hypothetical protein
MVCDSIYTELNVETKWSGQMQNCTATFAASPMSIPHPHSDAPNYAEKHFRTNAAYMSLLGGVTQSVAFPSRPLNQK